MEMSLVLHVLWFIALDLDQILIYFTGKENFDLLMMLKEGSETPTNSQAAGGAREKNQRIIQNRW